MSDTPPPLAAELALGLLPAAERAEAERLRRADPRFAAEVAEWEAVIETWLAELPDHPVTPENRDGIAAPIDRSLPPSDPGGAAPRSAAVASDWPIWRPVAIAASLLACIMAGMLLSRPQVPPPPPAHVPAPPRVDGRFSMAQIGGAGAPHLATVLYDRGSGVLTIRIAAIATPPGPAKAPEIWLIDGAQPPHSLGFAPAGAATRVQASAPLQRALVDGAVMAITLEPVATAPHAAPSSKILGTGTISSI